MSSQILEENLHMPPSINLNVILDLNLVCSLTNLNIQMYIKVNILLSTMNKTTCIFDPYMIFIELLSFLY